MKEKDILRELASRYAEIAASDTNLNRILLHKKVNDLKADRPIVLMDEIPWEEMELDGELTCLCQDPFLRGIENELRRTSYRWEHFQADMVVRPYLSVPKVIRSTGIGAEIKFDESEHARGAAAKCHKYVDQLQTEEEIDRLHCETIVYDEEASKRQWEILSEYVGDVLPVKLCGEATGYSLGCKNWDDIAFLRGVDTLLYDLIDAPELMHKLVQKLTDIFLDKMKQYEELNLLDGDAYYVHSASALTNELHPDQAQVKMSQVWGRGMAQIFASVSPQMHDEFDMQYMKKAMEPFGLVYYGCCEPLHNKIDLVGQIPNLRKVSVTPWADVDMAAEAIGKKYVVSAKPNPSFLAASSLDAAAVRKELKHILDACRRNGCACELVLKDITTVKNRPQNLFEWERIARELVEQN